jgi:hypothetical protein
MRRFTSLLGGLASLLLFVGLVAALAITSGNVSSRPTPEPIASNPPTLVQAAPAQPQAAKPQPTISSQNGPSDSIPICNFSGNAPAVEPSVPSLDAYSFSQPKVVYQGVPVVINQWLPDNKSLLITRYTEKNSKTLFETLDTTTGVTKQYGESSGPNSKVFWLEREQAVAFSKVDFTQIKGQTRPTMTGTLKVGRGAQTEEVVTNLATPYLTIAPDRQNIAFLELANPDQLQAAAKKGGKWEKRAIGKPIKKKTGKQQNTQQRIQLEPRYVLRSAWHPDGTKVVLFSHTGTYLSDMVTNAVCEIDLGQRRGEPLRAVSAQWSPDGRLLALETTIRAQRGILDFVNITVVDTTTGLRRYVDFDSGYVFEMAWQPGSNNLASLVQVEIQDGLTRTGLFLVDAITGKTRRVLPSHTFSTGLLVDEGGALSVTSDGQKIAVSCPEPSQDTSTYEDRICTVGITTQP